MCWGLDWSGYSFTPQECWQLMYDTVDTTYDCIRIATGVLSTLKIKPDRMMKGGWGWAKFGRAFYALD